VHNLFRMKIVYGLAYVFEILFDLVFG